MAMPTRNSQGHVEQTVTQLSLEGVLLTGWQPWILMKFSKPSLPRQIFLIPESKCHHFRVLWRRILISDQEKKAAAQDYLFKSSLPLSVDEKCVSAIHWRQWVVCSWVTVATAQLSEKRRNKCTLAVLELNVLFYKRRKMIGNACGGLFSQAFLRLTSSLCIPGLCPVLPSLPSWMLGLLSSLGT